ncbi:MAG: bifunctional metallophosphatase/5'-nucleotidase [Novosphingobium sp.]
MTRCNARLAALALSLLAAGCAAPNAGHGGLAAESAAPVEVGIVAINDFHGALEPPKASVGAPNPAGGALQVPAGGAAWLASAVRQVQAAHPYHLTVSAGDLTSASQFASSIYLDEPAVGVANRLGIDFNAVGNHEFDRGSAELQRLQHGGCAKLTSAEPCRIEPFPGARFRYLAANVFGPDGQTIFPATALRSFGQGRRKVTVGVIGLTLRGTADLVSPDRIAGLRFTDEADAINAGVASLKAQGAQAVVVLIHQGIRTSGVQDPNGCDKPAGDLQPVLARLDPRVDLVVSGHTHWAYVCEFTRPADGSPLLFTSAGLYGKLVTDITLSIDPVAGRVVSRKAHNVIVQSEAYTGANGPMALTDAYPRFEPAPDVAQFVARYVAGAKASAAQVIGHLSGPATKGANAESATGGVLGHLIADAQLAASRGAGAEIALMNPFGIRAPLVPPADGQNAGAVTFGNVFQVQPFSNRLTTLSLSGAELKAVLEQGLDDTGPKQWLSPSEGFAYRYDMARAAGDRIVAMTLRGAAIDPARRYRVAVNSFLAQGGDGFSLFAKGTDAALGMTDLEALEAWIKAVPLRTVPGEAREQPTG